MSNNLLNAALRQSGADVIKIYQGIREGLNEDDVKPENRDVVAATLTVAVVNRLTQISESL